MLATYQALLNPAFASPLRADYSMLTGVTQVSENTVRFNLAYPYAPFPDKLVLGILPAPALSVPGPVGQAADERQPGRHRPVHTGVLDQGQQAGAGREPALRGGRSAARRR